MKIVFHSNAPWTNTGYGVQSRIVYQLRDALGHEVIFSGFYGNQGSPQMIDGMLFLPSSKDGYGNDMLAQHADYHKADIVIILCDAWVFNPQVTSQMRTVFYAPVDTDPIAPGVVNSLRPAFRVIAYSKWGQDKMKEAGIQALYVPHYVDTKVFSPMDKIEARKASGIPEDRQDWFFAGIVAANKGAPSRKAFDQQIRAFAEFWRSNPKSMLILHADIWGGWQGEDLGRICELAGLPQEAIVAPPRYEFEMGMIGNDYMRRLYCSMDVLMNATRAEGFGVPIVEAMACGRPAIITDFSAMPELVDAGAGWKVRYAEKFFYQNSYQVIPDTKDITRALHEAYEARNDVSLQDKARAGMVKEYDIDHVVQTYWKPVLAQMESDIREMDAKKAQRAERRKAAQVALVKPAENGAQDKPVLAEATEIARPALSVVEKTNGASKESGSPVPDDTTISANVTDLFTPEQVKAMDEEMAKAQAGISD